MGYKTPTYKFPKGVSGNPLGRPKKDFDLKEKCQELTPSMLQTIISIANDQEQKTADRIECCKFIVAYGHGRPMQKQELTGVDNSPLIPKLLVTVRDKPE
jgi:hypothetical protein